MLNKFVKYKIKYICLLVLILQKVTVLLLKNRSPLKLVNNAKCLFFTLIKNIDLNLLKYLNKLKILYHSSQKQFVLVDEQLILLLIHD